MPPSAGRSPPSSSNASHIRRARSRLAAASTSRGRPPGHRLAGEQQRLGEPLADQIEVVQHGQHGPALAVPAPDQVEQIARGPGVDRGERLVEQDQARILQQQPREQDALQLAARQRADRPRAERRRARPPPAPARSARARRRRRRGTPPVERHRPMATKSPTEIGNERSTSASCGR